MYIWYDVYVFTYIFFVRTKKINFGFIFSDCIQKFFLKPTNRNQKKISNCKNNETVINWLWKIYISFLVHHIIHGIKQILNQTKFLLVSDQSENGKYNLNSVNLIRINKKLISYVPINIDYVKRYYRCYITYKNSFGITLNLT